MRICVITYCCKVVVGPGAHLCTRLEVWVLGVGMSKIGAQTAVRRGSGAPSTDDPGAWQHLIGPDFPSIETRQLGRGFQIGMFRPIRVDHTNCLQVVIKTHSFIGGAGFRATWTLSLRCLFNKRFTRASVRLVQVSRVSTQ
jgi:hypothetical protein